MLLSLNWLKEHLLKTDIKFDAKELSEKLTMRGLSVAAIRQPSTGLDNVVVGRIEHIEKHPNADRLQVTKIVIAEPAPDGTPADRLQIVCGAKNIAVGDIVPVALVGAVLPGDFAIKQSSIRGVDSSGMLCSAKELGVSDDSEGILQLPKHAHLGDAVSRLLGGREIDDTILEFELTPNRGDCLSVLGLAREIAPLLKTKVRDHKPARFRTSAHRTSSIVNVVVDAPELCPRYVGRVIDSLKVTDSPDWMKQRLQAVGVRPVNNIVDVTNFVMLEYGTPLHAFDLRKIESGGIRVAPCKVEMDFTLLTGQRVELMPGDILILDGERPIALAGIMGGANSHIEPETTSILLESAAFDAAQIRRTAKRLGIHTDASKRFEKGVDVLAVPLASERAAALLRDSFNANVYHPAIDTNETGYKEQTIAVDMRDVRKNTGLKQLSAETVVDLLDSIGIVAQKKSINVLAVKLPSWRPDLTESIDIVEEVARLNGYEIIPQNFPLSPAMYDRSDETQYDFERRVRQLLSSLGLRETIHYSFTSEDNLSRYGLLSESTIKLANPISEEMKVMRTSLLPSLLQTYSYNRNRKQTEQRIFEVGRVYFDAPEEETKAREVTFAAGVLSGAAIPASWATGKTAGDQVDFFHGKGIIEALARQLTGAKVTYEPPKNSRLFHPNRSAVLKLGNKEIGAVGEAHPYIRTSVLETNEAIVLFELNLDALRRFERGTVRYKVPSKYPAVEIDIALLVDKPHPAGSLADGIRQAAGALLSDVTVFDVYEGEHVAADKKSIAFHLVFNSPDRTLQEGEVTALRDQIVQSLGAKFGAQLRA